jgi:SOS-response transcriptional repressor LexA
MQEIGRALALRSTGGVHRLVSVLVERGYMTRAPRESRGIAATDTAGHPGPPAPTLPIQGAAIGESLVVDPRLLGSADPDRCLVAPAGADYARAAVREGDLLVIERGPASALRANELVAVRRVGSVVARVVDGALEHGVIGRVKAVVRIVG